MQWLNFYTIVKLGLHMTFLSALQTRKIKQYSLDFRARNLVPKYLRITIVHEKPTNVCGWEGRSACSSYKITINKSRVMAGVWEGGYAAKNWDKWDSNSCSHYKSVQILIITVYHKRLFISCFSLPNCHQLPYPSALGAQPLQPLFYQISPWPVLFLAYHFVYVPQLAPQCDCTRKCCTSSLPEHHLVHARPTRSPMPPLRFWVYSLVSTALQ